MPKLYIIDTCSEEQNEAVIQLCRETFLPALGEGIEENIKQFQEQLANSHVLVATIEKKVVGFAAYDFVRDDPIYETDFVQRQLYYARNRNLKDHLLGYLRGVQQEFGGEAFIEYFENDFTLTDRVKVCDEDVILTHLSVISDARRMGIGQALTKARLRIAKKKGATAAYVNCWEAGAVHKLYEKLGFHSIIRAGPDYRDGSAGRMMGLLLPEVQKEIYT
ncbi:MAG: GNAT family N-acetyltransferase [Nanoarchaeota archaeon]